MKNQSAKSPDLNILDRGFFNAIQSVQHESCAASIKELVDVVSKAFHSMPHTILADTFITLRAVMREVLHLNAGNVFKILHLNKQGFRRKGEPITTIFVEQ